MQKLFTGEIRHLDFMNEMISIFMGVSLTMNDRIMSRQEVQGQSRFIAFLDECGDHSMEKIDSDFPLFVLATVVVERQAYMEKIVTQMNSFKLRYWDHEGINLHTRDIRKAEGPFSILKNSKRRERFLTELTTLMKELPYTLFVVGIHKQRHLERYKDHARNPYKLALTFAFERISYFLKQKNEKHLPVIAEARGKNEDRDLEIAFYKLLAEGTNFIGRERFNFDCPLLFENKKKNICGIQLADLCAYPSARHILKPKQTNRSFEVVKEHIYDGENVKGWKVFP